MDDLAVHDVVVQDQVRLAAGKSAKVKHVTFYVGAQGPFFFDTPDSATWSDLVQAHIQQTVANLRAVTTRQY